MNLLTTRAGIGEPPSLFTADVATNRKSIQKLAALRPRLVCAGHGPPQSEGAAEALLRLAKGFG